MRGWVVFKKWKHIALDSKEVYSIQASIDCGFMLNISTRSLRQADQGASLSVTSSLCISSILFSSSL